MSLLTDAVQRSQEARRQEIGRNAAAPAPSGTERAPPSIPCTPPTPSAPSASGSGPCSLPDPVWHLEAIGAEPLSAEPRPAPPMAVSSLFPATDDAAGPVFAAQRRPAGSAPWRIAGAGLLTALGIGSWFWWQLPPPPGVGKLAAAPPVAAVPAASPDALVPSRQSPDGGTASPTADTAAALPVLETAPTPSSPSPSPVPVKKNVPAAAPVAADSELRANASRREPQPEAAAEFLPTRSAPRVSATLRSAYESLQAGRYQEAQRDYERALAGDGKSVDALLGLATLAALRSQTDQAHDYYARALEADPADATAQAGVVGTRRQGDAEADESLLKNALAGQPDSPPLHFALGNLYARQQRWSEAQEAYFRAYAGDPDNPDVTFNLAVSLDHLRQDRLAIRYYRMALEAGEARTPSFDRNQVTSRLEALQP